MEPQLGVFTWALVLHIFERKIYNPRLGTLLLEKSAISSEVGYSDRCTLPEVQLLRQGKDSICCGHGVICVSSRDRIIGKNPVAFLERRKENGEIYHFPYFLLNIPVPRSSGYFQPHGNIYFLLFPIIFLLLEITTYNCHSKDFCKCQYTQSMQTKPYHLHTQI